MFEYCVLWLFFFFFQAEDGIRDLTVTGVQTCALPISGPAPAPRGSRAPARARPLRQGWPPKRRPARQSSMAGSEEGRGGEEGRSRWAPDHLKKKKKTCESRETRHGQIVE